MELYVGCSGWFYRAWRGKFYPQDLPTQRWFQYYQQFFNAVEINSTFYRMPKEKNVRQWLRGIRDGFYFVVKAHRSLSHWYRWADWPAYYQGLKPVWERLRAILIQFPPSFRFDLERLAGVFPHLRTDILHVLEFRHPSWFQHIDEVRARCPAQVALCSVSAPVSTGLPEQVLEVHDVVYLRFHGRTQWYRYKYTEEELAVWVKEVMRIQPRVCFAFFNNDVGAHAPFDAQTLHRLFHKAMERKGVA